MRRFRNEFSCTFSIPQFRRDIFCRFTSPAILNTSFSSLFMKLPFKFNTCTSGEIPLGTVVKSLDEQSAVFLPPVHLQRHFFGQLFVKSAEDSGNNADKRSSSGKKARSGKELISPPGRQRLTRRSVTDGPASGLWTETTAAIRRTEPGGTGTITLRPQPDLKLL